MDPGTVGGAVEALVSTYAVGLECYTKWQRQKSQENHYHMPSKDNTYSGNSSALSTSLSFSGRKIREAFDGGVDILGDRFAIGDETCRKILQANLEYLQERIYALRKATRADNGPFEAFEAMRVSESVRVSCLAALANQYKRVAVGLLVPRVLPGSQRQPRLSATILEEDPVKPTDDNGDDVGAEDKQQMNDHTPNSSKPPHMQSEPPSPPPTPKLIPNDLPLTCTSITSSSSPRPKNGVFSLFCSEAMRYQVNPRETVPEHCRCRCGYDWDGAHAKDKAALVVKEGFQITPRFLGKSHCEGGFGCVLCTSSGRTETYASIGDLRDHINASHSKWQLLHDQDMTGL
ncbi:hypothetical protein AAE478_009561 [Parahypoxylon ruwenzoriense]